MVPQPSPGKLRLLFGVFADALFDAPVNFSAIEGAEGKGFFKQLVKFVGPGLFAAAAVLQNHPQCAAHGFRFGAHFEQRVDCLCHPRCLGAEVIAQVLDGLRRTSSSGG